MVPCDASHSIHIGGQIEIHLAEQRSGRVTLAIKAPKSLSISRTSSRNSDGQGAPTPQPSATKSPSSTKIQE